MFFFFFFLLLLYYMSFIKFMILFEMMMMIIFIFFFINLNFNLMMFSCIFISLMILESCLCIMLILEKINTKKIFFLNNTFNF